MLFLLTDQEGRALLIAETGTKDEADRFGRNHLPEYRDSIEIDFRSDTQAAEFWGVRTVKLVQMVLNPDQPAECRGSSVKMSFTWVRGPALPEDVVADDLLTPDNLRDLTLDHIARLSDFMCKLEIVKRT